MIKRYKSCIKCGTHSYLTMGGFYFCTNGDCLYKDKGGLNDEEKKKNRTL